MQRRISIENDSYAIQRPASPQKFGHKHYVPILKSKEGELWALGNTTPARKSCLTPVLELHVGPPAKTVAQHAASVLTQIEEAWGTRRFFLDTHLHGLSSAAGAQACTTVFSLATARKLNFVPVVPFRCQVPFRNAIAPYVNQDRGCMIRLKPGDFEDQVSLETGLDALLTTFGISAGDVDLLLDYEAVADSLQMGQQVPAHINLLPQLSNWRTITTAGGSFPTSLASQTPNVWQTLPRKEWGAWSLAIANTSATKLKRKPAFGDYGIRDTTVPSGIGFPYPNIRYTSNGSFLVQRNNVLVKDGGSPSVRTMCSSLMQRQEWRGSTFSEGDSQLASTTNPANGPGNAGNWTAWGMNHHFASVVDEIQSLP